MRLREESHNIYLLVIRKNIKMQGIGLNSLFHILIFIPISKYGVIKNKYGRGFLLYHNKLFFFCFIHLFHNLSYSSKDSHVL